jgi:hypothetical protein
MKTFFKSLFDIDKIPARFFFLFCVITGFILLAGDATLDTLHLANIEEKYGEIVGVVFLVSTGMVIINTFLWFQRVLMRKRNKKKRGEWILKEIGKFTPNEKAVIREFAVSNVRTISAPIDDPTVSGLLHKKILYIALPIGGTSTIMHGNTTSIAIRDDVMESIKREDIEMNDNPTQDDVDFLNNNRPSWTPRYGEWTLREG